MCLEDLEQLLPKEKAAQALKVLDVDGDGKVSLHDMRDAVIQIYNERKNLAFTLKDTWTVVGKLEFVIGISIHLLFGFFYLLIFEVCVLHASMIFALSSACCIAESMYIVMDKAETSSHCFSAMLSCRVATVSAQSDHLTVLHLIALVPLA